MAARLFAILAVSPRSAMAAVSPRSTMAARLFAILAVAVLFADTSGFTVRETNRLDELPPSIRALLAKMTTAEKARQLVLDDAITVATYDGAFNETLAAAYLGGLGAGVLNWGRDVDPNLANAIQDAVVAASRHGIPALFAEECQHGVQGDHHTIFPSPPALAATFDVDLLRAVGAVVGCAEFKYSTRLQFERTRQLRRRFFGFASRTRREKSIRPKISGIDFDLTELERFEVWSGRPKPVVEFGTGRGRGGARGRHGAVLGARVRPRARAALGPRRGGARRGRLPGRGARRRHGPGHDGRRPPRLAERDVVAPSVL